MCSSSCTDLTWMAWSSFLSVRTWTVVLVCIGSSLEPVQTCGDRMDGVSTALGGLFDVFFPDVEWDWCCILLELHHVISVICTNNDGIFHVYIFAFTAICPLLCGWLICPVYWLFGWCEGPSKHSWNYTWMSCTIMTPICIK